MLIVGTYLALTFLFVIARSIKSQKAGPYCLLYHESSEEFEFIPIFKAPFRVKKKDFVTLRRNFFTDFLVIGAYYENGKLRGAQLGWSLDVSSALESNKEIRK